MRKQGGVKLVGTRFNSKQKKGRSKTKLQRPNRKQKKKQNKDVSTTPVAGCFNLVIYFPLEHSPIDGSLINKNKKKRRNVVFTSSKEEIQTDNTSQNTPLVRRVTRSMVKRKFQIVQREMSSVLVEDSSPERKLDPQLDLCWNSEAEEAHNLHSLECMSPMQDPHKYPLEEPVIPQYVQNEEKISSPPNAETQVEDSKLQKKMRKLKRALREYKVLVKVVQEENIRYKEHNLKLQEVIEKMQRKHRKSIARTFCWAKKSRLQREKVKVLKKKIKALRKQASPSGTRLNILANATTLC